MEASIRDLTEKMCEFFQNSGVADPNYRNRLLQYPSAFFTCVDGDTAPRLVS
jgi:hypothetical protein